MRIIIIAQLLQHPSSSRYLESANHTCGSFAPDVDEIAVSGLHTMPSMKVKPERITEAAVHMECQVLHICKEAINLPGFVDNI